MFLKEFLIWELWDTLKISEDWRHKRLLKTDGPVYVTFWSPEMTRFRKQQVVECDYNMKYR